MADKRQKLKPKLIFTLMLISFVVVLALTVLSFFASGYTSKYNGNTQRDSVYASVKYNEATYSATEDNKLKCFNQNGDLLFETPLKDRALTIKANKDCIAVAYVNARAVDIFDYNGALIANHAVLYNINDITIGGDTLYIGMIKGGLDGGSIVAVKNFITETQQISTGKTEIGIPVSMTNDGDNAYVISRDFGIHKILTGQTVTLNRITQIPYEPLGLGFYNNQLIAADKTGYVYFFNPTEKDYTSYINTKMSGYSFAVNSVSGKAVYTNISGGGKFIDLESKKVINYRIPSESAFASVSDDGQIALCQPRGKTVTYYDFSMLGFAAVCKIVRWIMLVLTAAVAIFAIVLSFRLTEPRKAKLQVFTKKLKRGVKKHTKSYSFILPTFILLVLFMYVPTIWGLFLSFFDYVPGVYSRFVGFENFAKVFGNEFFWSGVLNMLIFLVTDVVKALVPAVIIAELIIALRSKRGQYVVRILMYIPGILPGVAVMLIWMKGIYGEFGLINSIFNLFNFSPHNWLGDSKTALGSLIFMGFPWVGQYILFYGALMSIPPSYKESAKLDGCTWIKSIIYIDLPLILPQLKYVFILSFISSIQDFGRVYLTTDGGPANATNIPALQLFKTLNSGNAYGEAAAMGMILFIFVFVGTLLSMKMQKKESKMV